MFLIFACLIASGAAAPAIYDQRQDGDRNVDANIENIVFLVAIPQKLQLPFDVLDYLKTNKQSNQPELQDRADIQVMEAFVEPNTPYRVEIGMNDRSAVGDGRAAEVVISGQRRLDSETQVDSDELKLIGATEQCGPERERDPVTLVCRLRSQPDFGPEHDSIKKNVKIESQPTPEVIPS